MGKIGNIVKMQSTFWISEEPPKEYHLVEAQCMRLESGVRKWGGGGGPGRGVAELRGRKPGV